jgi:hypothetical protein
MVALSIHTYANVGPNTWLRSVYISRTSIVTSDTGHRHFNFGRLWQKTRIEVVCCYISHHPTVLSPLSRLQCDNQKLVYFLVNSSCLYVLSRKFISHITLTFRFNLMSHTKYIVLCGVLHLVMYII